MMKLSPTTRPIEFFLTMMVIGTIVGVINSYFIVPGEEISEAFTMITISPLLISLLIFVISSISAIYGEADDVILKWNSIKWYYFTCGTVGILFSFLSDNTAVQFALLGSWVLTSLSISIIYLKPCHEET